MIKDAAHEAINTRVGQQQLQEYRRCWYEYVGCAQDTLMQAVYQQESGDRHRNADGSLVTSPKVARKVSGR
jgi:hypothetical protein